MRRAPVDSGGGGTGARRRRDDDYDAYRFHGQKDPSVKAKDVSKEREARKVKQQRSASDKRKTDDHAEDTAGRHVHSQSAASTPTPPPHANGPPTWLPVPQKKMKEGASPREARLSPHVDEAPPRKECRDAGCEAPGCMRSSTGRGCSQPVRLGEARPYSMGELRYVCTEPYPCEMPPPISYADPYYEGRPFCKDDPIRTVIRNEVNRHPAFAEEDAMRREQTAVGWSFRAIDTPASQGKSKENGSRFSPTSSSPHYPQPPNVTGSQTRSPHGPGTSPTTSTAVNKGDLKKPDSANGPPPPPPPPDDDEVVDGPPKQDRHAPSPLSHRPSASKTSSKPSKESPCQARHLHLAQNVVPQYGPRPYVVQQPPGADRSRPGDMYPYHYMQAIPQAPYWMPVHPSQVMVNSRCHGCGKSCSKSKSSTSANHSRSSASRSVVDDTDGDVPETSRHKAKSRRHRRHDPEASTATSESLECGSGEHKSGGKLPLESIQGCLEILRGAVEEMRTNSRSTGGAHPPDATGDRMSPPKSSETRESDGGHSPHQSGSGYAASSRSASQPIENVIERVVNDLKTILGTGYFQKDQPSEETAPGKEVPAKKREKEEKEKEKVHEARREHGGSEKKSKKKDHEDYRQHAVPPYPVYADCHLPHGVKHHKSLKKQMQQGVEPQYRMIVPHVIHSPRSAFNTTATTAGSYSGVSSSISDSSSVPESGNTQSSSSHTMGPVPMLPYHPVYYDQGFPGVHPGVVFMYGTG